MVCFKCKRYHQTLRKKFSCSWLCTMAKRTPFTSEILEAGLHKWLTEKKLKNNYKLFYLNSEIKLTRSWSSNISEQQNSGLCYDLEPSFWKFQVQPALRFGYNSRMLQEDKQLFQLYNDLVVCGVISAEEFWANRLQVKQGELANIAGISAINQSDTFLQSSKDTILRQNVGVSPAFLSEIKPQSTGANSISYNLTTDMMEAIFKTYPQGRADDSHSNIHQDYCRFNACMINVCNESEETDLYIAIPLTKLTY